MKYIAIAEVIDSGKLKHFIALARQYQLLMEEQQPVSPTVFLPKVQLLLADLYSAALKLDWIDLQSDVDYELEKIDLEKILQVVAGKIGDHRYYWSVFDPTDMEDTAPSCGDLLDDLGDIYKDLQYSLRVFDLQTADSQETAVFEFKFDFEKHWGYHCINALRALHFFLQKLQH